MYFRKSKAGKNSRNKPNDHIYDELDMYTMLNAKTASSTKTPSPKSDKVIFDTKGNEPPGYQSIPAPRYEDCSNPSLAKFNLSNDNSNKPVADSESDAESIKDEDCEAALEKMADIDEFKKIAEQEGEENFKEHERYCKLRHFN